MENYRIAILMATYNGEKYLKEQIDSIISQTCQDWHLYIHDDGSKDSTIAIIKDYICQYPDSITLLDYPPQGGACWNFLSMLEKVEAPYYMFCDQDDVWNPNKTEISIQVMKELEMQYPDKPIIVHSDARIVDSQLNLVHPSHRAYSHIYPEKVTSFNQCVINVAPGCCMLFNAKAKETALARPWTAAIMHDAWVIVCTYAANGIVHAIPTALMDYRNHGNNTVGAIEGSQFTIYYRIRHFKEMIHKNIQQYRMLRSAGYGSIFTYYYYKFNLHIH